MATPGWWKVMSCCKVSWLVIRMSVIMMSFGAIAWMLWWLQEIMEAFEL